MLNVEVTRFENHPSGALGRISYGGDGGPWHAIIDKNGHPHLVLKVEGGWTEYFNFLPKGAPAPHEVIDCTPGDAATDDTPAIEEDAVTDEDVAECMAEYQDRCAQLVRDGCFTEAVCLVGLMNDGREAVQEATT